MAALIERQDSGQGQWVQTSLLEAMIAMLDFQATRWLIGGEVAPQAGNDHPTGFPTGVFPTKDGMINIAANGERMWRDFLRVCGAEEFGDDERFNTPRARATHRAELREVVEHKLRERPSAEWIAAFNEAGVPCGPILTIDKVFADPQVQHLGLAQQVESDLYGPLTLVRSPTRLSRTPTSLRSASPYPGGQTNEVLAEYGYTADEIERLTHEGAVGAKAGSTNRGFEL
jgi:formyl-CoA transferase